MTNRTFLTVCLTSIRIIWAADQLGPHSNPAMEPAAALQQQSVAAMQASIAAQRASIARQTDQQARESFFVLPHISPPGATNSGLGANCQPIAPVQMDSIIQDAAKAQNLQPELLRAVIKQESGFSPCAVSPKGAMGLMQLMPATAKRFNVKYPLDPKENVDGGARLLKRLLVSLQDFPLALGAYNAGLGKVMQAGGVPDIPETQSYVRSILSVLPPNLVLPKASQ